MDLGRDELEPLVKHDGFKDETIKPPVPVFTALYRACDGKVPASVRCCYRTEGEVTHWDVVALTGKSLVHVAAQKQLSGEMWQLDGSDYRTPDADRCESTIVPLDRIREIRIIQGSVVFDAQTGVWTVVDRIELHADNGEPLVVPPSSAGTRRRVWEPLMSDIREALGY